MKGKWPVPVFKWKGALERYKYALLVLAAGLLLLALPLGGGGGEQPEAAQAQAEEFDLEAFEEKLGRALSQIQGAGEVRVVLTLDSGARQVLAQDQDRDGEGYTTSTVTLSRGSGQQEVVSLQTVAPSFRGALVVCPGGGDPQVRLELAQAVAALTGLGADRITICQGNGETK